VLPPFGIFLFPCIVGNEFTSSSRPEFSFPLGIFARSRQEITDPICYWGYSTYSPLFIFCSFSFLHAGFLPLPPSPFLVPTSPCEDLTSLIIGWHAVFVCPRPVFPPQIPHLPSWQTVQFPPCRFPPFPRCRRPLAGTNSCLRLKLFSCYGIRFFSGPLSLAAYRELIPFSLGPPSPSLPHGLRRDRPPPCATGDRTIIPPCLADSFDDFPYCLLSPL